MYLLHILEVVSIAINVSPILDLLGFCVSGRLGHGIEQLREVEVLEYFPRLLAFAGFFRVAFSPISASAASFQRTDPIADCILFVLGLADQLAQIIVAFP